MRLVLRSLVDIDPETLSHSLVWSKEDNPIEFSDYRYPMRFKTLHPKPVPSLSKAFTLSELLIAVAILGLIATFTIPKVLQSTETQKNKTILKELVSIVTSQTLQAIQEGQTTGTGAKAAITPRLAAQSFDGANTYTFASGGSVRITPGNSPDNHVQYLLDANGTAGPNTQGTDQIHLAICLTNQLQYCTESPNLLGKVNFNPIPWPGFIASEALYRSLF